MKTMEQLAEECGILWASYGWHSLGEDGIDSEDLARFAAAVRREALEEAAKVCDEGWSYEAVAIADRIRSLQSPPSPEGTADKEPL